MQFHRFAGVYTQFIFHSTAPIIKANSMIVIWNWGAYSAYRHNDGKVRKVIASEIKF